MSDTEDEPFDKEAEKEELRQQLAEEEAAREATQHMSELLLKGATMTNRHCDACGDPLFRHEGREFCPTCGREAAGGPQQAGEEAAGQEDPTAGAERQASGAGGPETAQQGSSQPPAEASDPLDDATAQPRQPAADSQPRTDAQPSAESADLPAAREALARKVTALARQAEATDDVGRARELLAAVREGAQALRALEGRDR